MEHRHDYPPQYKKHIFISAWNKLTHLGAVASVLEDAYERIEKGGWQYKYYEDFLREPDVVWEAFSPLDGWENGKIVAVIAYKQHKYGKKIFAIGCKDTKTACKILFDALSDNLTDISKHMWGEVSGIPERWLKSQGFVPISNVMAQKILEGKELSLHEDGYHYDRIISGKVKTKVIYGNIKL